MKIKHIVSVIFCLIFTSCPAFAAESALDSYLERLVAETAKIESLKSDFTQTKYISFMDETLVSEGFFTFKTPDAIEWQYTKPVESGLVYKDGKARLWSSAAAGALPAGDNAGGEDALAKVIAEQLITWTRLDIPKLKQSYEIKLLDESPLTICLTPKNKSSGDSLESIQLIFDKDGTNVRQITLFEAEDDYTRIDFINFQRQ